VRCRAAPGTQGPLVKLLVGILALRHAFVWSSGAIVSWLVDPHNQPINFSSLRACMSEGRGEMQGLPQAPGPLVKLLVEFHSPCGMHSFGRGGRKSIVL
jgi:hypothetical protein